MKRLNQTGFTVMELIVASVITGIVMIGVLTFITTSLVNNSITVAKSDLLREAQLALDSIASDIRLSANVDVLNRWEDSNSPNAATTNGFGWEADSGTLILAKAAQNSDGKILFQDATNYLTFKDNYIYYRSGDSLYRRVLAANVADNRAVSSCPQSIATDGCPADRELVRNVTNYSLRYLNNQDEEVEPGLARSVEITLELSREKFNRTVTAKYVTRTVFRNE